MPKMNARGEDYIDPARRRIAVPVVVFSFSIALMLGGCTKQLGESSDDATVKAPVGTDASSRSSEPLPHQEEEARTAPASEPSSRPRSILELPEDPAKPASAWIEPGRPPTTASLSADDLKKLNAWLEKRLNVTKAGDCVIEYYDITTYNPPDESVNVFQPPSFSGKAVHGGPNQALTDGRLTLTVTEAKKKPAWDGPFQYEIAYVLENKGNVALNVDHFENLFFDLSGTLAAAFEQRALKQEGNNYTVAEGPDVYEPGSRSERSMSSHGECKSLNNICLHVFYADGTESMFVVYLPPEMIVDETSAS